MRKIFGFYNVGSDKDDVFNEKVLEVIRELQEEGQEVEVQYTTNVLPNGRIHYSALIIGRKEV